MRVEFIELLRCPAPHMAAPLITVADQRDGDDILEATLGCVVCGAEYILRDGCVEFAVTDTAAVYEGRSPVVDDDAMRLAALLALADVTTRAVLAGDLARQAVHIESLTGARCLAINSLGAEREARAPDRIRMAPGDRLPLGDASLHGLAVDERHALLLHDALRVVRRGGRIVAPVSVPLPDGCRELARDDRQWVAEVVTSASAPVPLQRATGMRPETLPR